MNKDYNYLYCNSEKCKKLLTIKGKFILKFKLKLDLNKYLNSHFANNVMLHKITYRNVSYILIGALPMDLQDVAFLPS